MTKTQNNRQIKKSRTRLLVFVIILVGGLMPPILYWSIYGQTEMVTPTEAKDLLLREDSNAVLIDIRSKEKYDSAHIDGSYYWPTEEIFSLESKEKVPEQFHDMILLLICDSGILSNFATKHLAGIGIQKAMSVRGGIQEWIGSVQVPEGGDFERYKSASGHISELPIRISPYHEKLAAVISGYVIKPTYTVLSLLLAILLWRKKAFDLSALRWSMIFFFIGENFCAINYLLFEDKSYLAEYLHSLGMLLSFGFATYAVFEGMDSRILMLSDPNKKCAALNLCRKCIKYENVPCGLKRTFFMIIPASILLALMPLFADWHNNSYNTMIFGTFYHYTHRLIYQQFELLYCPIASIALLTISLLILTLKREDSLLLAKILFAAGIGPLGFGMLRSILAGLYSQNMVWFNFWEEGTELLFIVGVCFVLWVFRQSLFKTPNVGRE